MDYGSYLKSNLGNNKENPTNVLVALKQTQLSCEIKAQFDSGLWINDKYMSQEKLTWIVCRIWRQKILETFDQRRDRMNVKT